MKIIIKQDLELIKASEIEIKEVEWLWYPFIPLGKVTLIQGYPRRWKELICSIYCFSTN